MIGKPKYNYGDKVSFEVNIDDVAHTVEGIVEIIDRYGTFEQHEEVSYDVMVNDWLGSGEKMFVKHIIEPNLMLVKKGSIEDCELGYKVGV